MQWQRVRVLLVLMTVSVVWWSIGNAQPPLSVEELETLNQSERTKALLDDLITSAERIGKEWEQQCLLAFGHSSFCRCVRDRRPVATSFETYIMAVTKTKKELGYTKLKKEDQDLVNRLREARDQCVRAHL